MKKLLFAAIALALAVSVSACSTGNTPTPMDTPMQSTIAPSETLEPIESASAPLVAEPDDEENTEPDDETSIVVTPSPTQNPLISGEQIDLSAYDRVGAWGEGLCAVIQNGNLSFIDESGVTVDIPLEPRVYGKYDPLPRFVGGVAVLCKDVLDANNNYHLAYGTINKLGETVIDFTYQKMEIFTDGYTLAEQSYGDWAEWAVFDKTGNVIVAYKKPQWIRALTVEGEYVFVYITDINTSTSSYDVYRKDGSLATESTFGSLEEAMSAIGLR